MIIRNIYILSPLVLNIVYANFLSHVYSTKLLLIVMINIWSDKTSNMLYKFDFFQESSS